MARRRRYLPVLLFPERDKHRRQVAQHAGDRLCLRRERVQQLPSRRMPVQPHQHGGAIVAKSSIAGVEVAGAPQGGIRLAQAAGMRQQPRQHHRRNGGSRAPARRRFLMHQSLRRGGPAALAQGRVR